MPPIVGAMTQFTFAGRRVRLPGNRLLRVGLGILLVLCGALGFLPVLGFWMIPLGLGILGVDFPPARRFYRRATVWTGGFLHRRWPVAARRFGFGAPRNGKR